MHWYFFAALLLLLLLYTTYSHTAEGFLAFLKQDALSQVLMPYVSMPKALVFTALSQLYATML